jgi:CRP-like cAMP-binding protein
LAFTDLAYEPVFHKKLYYESLFELFVFRKGGIMSLAYDLFADSKKKMTFAPGDVVFKEGDKGDVMYVVLEGEVLIIAGSQVVDELSQGDLFGEMALIDDSPRSATATAKSEATLALVDQADFLFLVQHSPFFSIHVMRILAERMRRMLSVKG